MRCLFDDIGLVTAGVHSHLARLASIGTDPAGGGGSTSTVEDEETPDEKAERERLAAEGEDEGLDDEDQGRRRGRDTAAYRELQSDRDRLKHDLEAQQRQTQEMQERLTRIEGERTSRETVNAQANDRLTRARQLAEEVMGRVDQIPADAPDRGRKIYENLFMTVLETQEATAQDISTRTSRQTVETERIRDKQREDARRETCDLLEKAGLDPEKHFKNVRALARDLQIEDPNWFKETPKEDQIRELVEMVKDDFVETKRKSQEFKDEQKDHRRPMAGVIGEGSRTTRRSTRENADEDDDRQEGPGSILADLKRSKEAKRRNTNIMLRQADTR